MRSNNHGGMAQHTKGATTTDINRVREAITIAAAVHVF